MNLAFNLSSRKGQAGVIGGLIIVTLIFSIILPLILYYQETAEYSLKQAETGRRYLEDRAMELLNVTGLPYFSVVSIGHPVIEVSNIGSVRVTLKRIWLLKDSEIVKIVDLTGDNPLIVGLYLKEENRDLTGTTILPTLQPGYTLNITLNINLIEAVEYYFYLESDRGVLHPKEAVRLLVPGGAEFEEPQNILGPSRLYFFSFRWYLYNATDGSLTPPEGYENFTINVDLLKSTEDGKGRNKSKYDGIVFKVEILNMDFYRRSITLDGDTHIWIYYSGTGGALQKSEFCIMNNPITISYGESATVYFLAEAENIPKPGEGRSLLGYGNLLVHGTIDGLPFSQNIPFVGITFVRPK